MRDFCRAGMMFLVMDGRLWYTPAKLATKELQDRAARFRKELTFLVLSMTL